MSSGRAKRQRRELRRLQSRVSADLGPQFEQMLDGVDEWVMANTGLDELMPFLRTRFTPEDASEGDWVVVGALLERLPAELARAVVSSARRVDDLQAAYRAECRRLGLYHVE